MRVLTDKDYKLFEKLVSLKQNELRKAMIQYLKAKYEKILITKDYIVAIGEIPIALVAHMDTVFAKPVSNLFYDEKKGVLWSPEGLGADDRAGVFAILKILQTGLRPSVILTTDEEHHTSRGKAGTPGIQGMGGSANHGGGLVQRRLAICQRHRQTEVGHIGTVTDLLLGHGADISSALAIDLATTGNSDILTVFRIDKAAAVESGCVICEPEICHDLREIIDIGRAQEHTVTLDVQIHTGLQVDATTEVFTALQDHLTASVCRAIIDCCLNSLCTQRYAVTDSTVVFNIAIFHNEIPPSFFLHHTKFKKDSQVK